MLEIITLPLLNMFLFPTVWVLGVKECGKGLSICRGVARL